MTPILASDGGTRSAPSRSKVTVCVRPLRAQPEKFLETGDEATVAVGSDADWGSHFPKYDGGKTLYCLFARVVFNYEHLRERPFASGCDAIRRLRLLSESSRWLLECARTFSADKQWKREVHGLCRITHGHR